MVSGVIAIDRSVRPQDDFYRSVNAGWLDRTHTCRLRRISATAKFYSSAVIGVAQRLSPICFASVMSRDTFDAPLTLPSAFLIADAVTETFDQPPILGSSQSVKVFHSPIAFDPREDVAHLALSVDGKQRHDRSPEHLAGGIANNAFRARIPAGNDAVHFIADEASSEESEIASSRPEAGSACLRLNEWPRPSAFRSSSLLVNMTAAAFTRPSGALADGDAATSDR